MTVFTVSASVNQNIPSFLVNHPILHLDSTFVEGFFCNDTKNDVEPEEFKISKGIKSTEGFQKRLEILDDVSVICNYAGQTVMIRNLISDLYHGNKLSALKDVGFLATTALSPRLGPLFTRIGISQVAKEAKISGYAMKALGFGISRAISLYVLSDFIYNTVKSSNESLIVYFKDGFQIMLTKAETVQAALNSNLSIRKIEQLYAGKVRELGISFFAFSSVNNETI
uniref:Uncharacterized protein n=1 Tax=Romanomermis culicivorax TaxID=13658 RepID=A0A915KVU7_ROMCU